MFQEGTSLKNILFFSDFFKKIIDHILLTFYKNKFLHSNFSIRISSFEFFHQNFVHQNLHCKNHQKKKFMSSLKVDIFFTKMI